MKVAVIGAAGGIGQALALLLKNRLPAGSDLALYDIAPVTPGVAADLSHIPTPVSIKGYAGEDPTPALEGADVVLISAGVARKPGMDRADLFNVNAGIVKSLAEKIAHVCPKAMIGIITNPVNTTVPIAAEVLKKAGVYDKRRLFGVTTLDVIRSETFVADLKDKDPGEGEIVISNCVSARHHSYNLARVAREMGPQFKTSYDALFQYLVAASFLLRANLWLKPLSRLA